MIEVAVPDEQRCWHGRFFGERCPERGYPPRRLLGNATDHWLWCGRHGSPSPGSAE